MWLMRLHDFAGKCQRPWSRLGLAGLLILSAQSAFAQGAASGSQLTVLDAPDLLARFPAGSIHAEATAGQALAAAVQERGRIDARHAEEERACLTRFFVTACVDAVKEQRRSALEQVRPVEIEAEKFMRQLKAAERDQALTEKRAQEEAEAPARAQAQRDNQRAAAEKSAQRVQQAAASEITQKEQAADAAKRALDIQARQQRANAVQADDAQTRANNVAAYAKKVRESQARQAEIAARKKEKQQAQRANSAL